MAGFALRRARHADLPFLERLLKRSYDRLEEGYAYPRCETAVELLAEFKLYGLRLAQAVRIMEVEGKPVGAFGFLYSPEEAGSGTMIERSSRAMAYGIGPYFEPRWRSRRRLEDVLAHMERLAARRFGQLRLCVIEQNRELAGLLVGRGWSSRVSNLEMEWVTGDRQPPQPSPFPVRRIESADDPRLPAAAAMLAESFDWKDAPEQRLREYLEEGYRLGCVEAECEVVGVGIWIPVEDTSFGRLEYVTVLPGWRRRKAGSALVRAAQDDLRAAGDKEVFLSVDPENAAARALYRSQGFAETIHSTVFEKSFGDPS